MLKTNPSLAAEASATAEQALRTAAHAIDDARELAGQAADKVGETVRDLREGSSLAASRGADALGEAAAAARRRVNRYASAGARYASQEPVKTALIAAAIGAVAAALVLARRAD